MSPFYPKMEIKVLLDPQPGAAGILAALGIEENTAEVHDVAFFDTPDLQLFHGHVNAESNMRVILRARTKAGSAKGKTTCKLRSDTARLSDALQSDGDNRKREFDFALGRSIYDSFSVDDKQPASQIEAAFNAQVAFQKIFGGEQESLIDDALGGLDWSMLRAFGPVRNIRVWSNQTIAGLDDLVTLEHWELPTLGGGKGRTLIEISTRVDFGRCIIASFSLCAALNAAGLKQAASGTKTQLVLEYFQAE